MTHPGVGPVTALAFTLTMGPAKRFSRGKQIASYLGLIPSEYSSGGRKQRLGHISKQGNPFLRGLLLEAAQSAVRCEPETECGPQPTSRVASLSQLRPYFFLPGLMPARTFRALSNVARINTSPITNVATKKQ